MLYNHDIQKGIDAVLYSLLAPLRQICNNAGYEGDEIVEELKGKKGDFGFNAKTGEYVNMIEAGIIDPAKVTRTAVINAASISSLFVTTESIVTEMPKPQTPAPSMPSPDMDY